MVLHVFFVSVKNEQKIYKLGNLKAKTVRDPFFLMNVGDAICSTIKRIRAALTPLQIVILLVSNVAGLGFPFRFVKCQQHTFLSR